MNKLLPAESKKRMYLLHSNMRVEGVKSDFIISGIFENAVAVSTVYDRHCFVSRDDLASAKIKLEKMPVYSIKVMRRTKYFYGDESRKKRRHKGKGKTPFLDVFNRGRVYYYKKPLRFVKSYLIRDGFVLSDDIDDALLVNRIDDRKVVRAVAKHHDMYDDLKHVMVGRWERFYFMEETDFTPPSGFDWIMNFVKLNRGTDL